MGEASDSSFSVSMMKMRLNRSKEVLLGRIRLRDIGYSTNASMSSQLMIIKAEVRVDKWVAEVAAARTTMGVMEAAVATTRTTTS